MAIHRDRAQVYSVHGLRIRSIGVGEAYAMIRSGQARLISSSRSTKVSIQLNVTLSPDGQGSQISITFAEMQAIAGEFGAPLPHRMRIKRYPDGTKEVIEIPENFAYCAQQKLIWWPYVGGRRSLRVRPRRGDEVR